MSGVRITTGGDEAASKLMPRIITFPDGQARHISLENRYWSVLEQLHTKKGWPRDEIARLAYQGATDFYAGSPEFEKQLRYAFVFLLKTNMAFVMKDEGDWITANDDGCALPSPAPQLERLRLRTIFNSTA